MSLDIADAPSVTGANGAVSHWEREPGDDNEPTYDVPDSLDTWADPPEERPTIQLVQGELVRVVSETIAALAAGDKNLFQRNGELVTIVREPESAEPYSNDRRKGRDVLMRPGTPKIKTIGIQGLTLRVARCAAFERYKEARSKKEDGEWRPADPDSKIMAIVHKPDDEWPAIHPLLGILETPALAPSGRIIERPGYDEETGHMMIPSCEIKPILDHPTRDQAKAALRYLWIEMACDFPFKGMGEPLRDGAVDMDPDRSVQFAKSLECPDAYVGVAALLTVFSRLAIDGAVPGCVFEAPGQGSGKSLQMHTVSIIATSRPASAATFPMKDGRPDEQELEKICAGYALSGARIVAFDNIRGLLSGSTLEKALTAVKNIDIRVLGLTGQQSLPWVPVTMYSGNNMVMNDDIAQRMLTSRIESPRENPRKRPASTFRHAELLGALHKRRANLVRAVLTILRAYLMAKKGGESVPDVTLGSYEAWSRIVPGALLWAGGPNILDAQPELGRGGDEEGEAHVALMRGWLPSWDMQPSSIVLAEAFKADERAMAKGEVAPDGLSDVRGAIRALTRTPEGRAPSPSVFGAKMKLLRQKIREGMRIVNAADKHAKNNLWRVEYVNP